MKIGCSCGAEWDGVADEGMDVNTLMKLQDAIKHLKENPSHTLHGVRGSKESANE